MLIAFDCRIIRDKNPAGIARVVLEFLKQVLTCDRKNDYILIFDSLEMKDFVLYYLRYIKKKCKVLIVPFKLMTFSDMIYLPKILQDRNVDVYYLPYYITSPFHKKSYKVIITVFDLIHFLFPALKMSLGRRFFHFFPLIAKAIFKRADKIITISVNTSRDLVKKFRISPKKIKLIYMGVSDNFRVVSKEKALKLMRERFNVNKPYILYVGRNEPHKNLKAIILSYNFLPSYLKEKYQLVFVGKQEKKYYKPLEALINKYNLQEHVTFTGYVEESDLPYIYSGASIFVFPSFYEGFGLPILEAMKCGVPTVSSNTSSLTEVGGDAVLYSDPSDIAKISEHIKNVLEDEWLKKKMIKKGFNQVKKFSWFKAAQNLLDCFDELEE